MVGGVGAVTSVPRVLAVWCPDWPIVAAGEGADTPAVVVAAGRVTACSAAARATGVRRGQRLRDAQRHCPDLVQCQDDPDAQGRLFEQVAAAVEDFCPRVEVVRPGVCAIPVRGPARYFGGEQALAERVGDAVTARGFTCTVGVADGVFAAGLAARAGEAGIVVSPGGTPEFLVPHSVAVLDRAELASLLVRLGIRTLGEFAALPPGDVLARFGPDGGAAHRLARGLEPRPLATRFPREDLAAVMEFDPPVEAAERLVFAAKALADELHATLAGHGLTCARVEVEVATEDGRRWSRLWRHDGLLSALAVAERVRWQLDAWHTVTSGRPDALTGGVTLLRLAPDQLVVDTGRQLALWGQAVASDRVDRVAARIQVMLGQAGVVRPVLVGGRGPAEQVLRVPWGDAPADRHRPGGAVRGGSAPEGSWPGRVPEPAPAVVHPLPLPAVVADAHGRPVAVSARCTVSAQPARLAVDGRPPMAVTSWSGPWPATEHWWDPDRIRRRARFQMITADGRAWLLALEAGGWEVEATYT
jgi:protein ImuB